MRHLDLHRIKIQESINAVVESFLPKGSEDKTLFVTLNVRASMWLEEHLQDIDPDLETEYSEARCLRIAIQAPNNYIKVLYQFHKFDEEPTDTWNLVVDHDSCWRDGVDRCISALEKDIKESFEEVEINEEVEDALEQNDITFSNFISFGYFGTKGFLFKRGNLIGEKESGNGGYRFETYKFKEITS